MLVGNRTECGLLQLVSGLGADYAAARQQADLLRVLPFSSERKRMSTLTRQPGNRHACVWMPLALQPNTTLPFWTLAERQIDCCKCYEGTC